MPSSKDGIFALRIASITVFDDFQDSQKPRPILPRLVKPLLAMALRSLTAQLNGTDFSRRVEQLLRINH